MYHKKHINSYQFLLGSYESSKIHPNYKDFSCLPCLGTRRNFDSESFIKSEISCIHLLLKLAKDFFKFLPYMGVEPNIGGKPPKWMVKIMENPMNKWMIWGYPYFWKHPHGSTWDFLFPLKLSVLARCDLTA